MKRLITIALAATCLLATTTADAQTDKSKRASPPAKVTRVLNNGATITIDYSRPSLKGRTIGVDVEPREGEVWRTGANEATVFETNKDINIMGEKLPAGKYGLFTIFNGREVTLIFNKTWNQWGAYDYKAADDQLRVRTKVTEAPSSTEMLTFSITPEGQVTLDWGPKQVHFFIS